MANAQGSGNGPSFVFKILRVVAILFSVFYFFSSDETLKSTLTWLAFVILPTITVCPALLIMSIWRPARLFTGALMCISAAVSLGVLVFNCGLILCLAWGRIFAIPIGIMTAGIVWPLGVIGSAIYEGEGRFLLLIGAWLLIDIITAALGVLMLGLADSWIEEVTS